jgi:hypothetical protein
MAFGGALHRVYDRINESRGTAMPLLADRTLDDVRAAICFANRPIKQDTNIL